MFEDSQRVNTDLKARGCEEKSFLNTCCLHVNTIAKLVFDMMLHTELKVIGRSIDSILNMITDASQGDTAHIMVAAVMSPRAKGYDSDRGRGGNLMKTATRRFREQDLSQWLRRQQAQGVQPSRCKRHIPRHSNSSARGLITHGDQILISLSALGSARCLVHADMDETGTVAPIGDGHTFGEKHGACRERTILQPISP